jgi:hypothetical protein
VRCGINSESFSVAIARIRRKKAKRMRVAGFVLFSVLLSGPSVAIRQRDDPSRQAAAFARVQQEWFAIAREDDGGQEQGEEGTSGSPPHPASGPPTWA